MPLYVLDPVDLEHSIWARSTHKDRCRIIATNESDARKRAMHKFESFTESLLDEMHYGPWVDPGHVKVILDENQAGAFKVGTIEVPDYENVAQSFDAVDSIDDIADFDSLAPWKIISSEFSKGSWGNSRWGKGTWGGGVVDVENSAIVEMQTQAEPKTSRRLNLGAPGERLVVLSNPNGIPAGDVSEPLRVSREKLKELSEVLDGFVGQDASNGHRGDNQVEVPLAQEDLELLRSLVRGAIEDQGTPVITQGTADF